MVLFVPETCPRNSKRGFFVTFNDDLYLRNRKLPRGKLRLRRLLGGKLLRSRLRLRRGNLLLCQRRLLRGRLPWRMVPGNVAKDTPLGLDTGGWRLIEWRYNKGKERKETPMDIEIDFFEELGGYYTADLADVLADFEG
nr:MAG TPA: hypothetical protein [Caudoviricetes sp.]